MKLIALLLLVLAADAAAAPLRLPHVARPACPFECCQYGRWFALKTLRVHPRVRELRAVAFRIAAGESFTAVEGEVWINRPGEILARGRLPLYDGKGGRIFAPPGSRIRLLDYLGEGGMNAWFRGEFVGTNTEDWGRDNSLVTFVRWPDFEWWVRIRTGDGRTGWILVDDSRGSESESLPVDGSDGCG